MNLQCVNPLRWSDAIMSSGQPTSEDFQLIADGGYGTVINLAMSSSTNALPGEGDIVLGHGMQYIHLPIVWEAPEPAQFDTFSAVMQTLERATGSAPIWVHCALNMRVSAFLYLYHLVHERMDEADARALLHRIWSPNEIWWRFMKDVLERR